MNVDLNQEKLRVWLAHVNTTSTPSLGPSYIIASLKLQLQALYLPLHVTWSQIEPYQAAILACKQDRAAILYELAPLRPYAQI